MVLDVLVFLVCLDLLVWLWGQKFLDLWETPASLDWMESMVSKVLQVLPGHLVQVQPRETEEILVSRAFPGPPAGKENQGSPEVPVSPAVLFSKEDEVRPASVEVLVSRVSPVTLVSMETKEPREHEAVLVVRVSLEPRPLCHRWTTSNMEKLVFPVQAEVPVDLEKLVSLECPDAQVLRVVLVRWVNLEGLDLLVCPDLSVMADPPVSQDPLENKVPPEQPVVPVLPAASGAVTASATLW